MFSDFDSVDDPKKGFINFDEGICIPTFIRDADEYDAILKQLGMAKQLEEYPPFTQEFLEQYPIDRPTNESEYLILGYSKE